MNKEKLKELEEMIRKNNSSVNPEVFKKDIDKLLKGAETIAVLTDNGCLVSGTAAELLALGFAMFSNVIEKMPYEVKYGYIRLIREATNQLEKQVKEEDKETNDELGQAIDELLETLHKMKNHMED